MVVFARKTVKRGSKVNRVVWRDEDDMTGVFRIPDSPAEPDAESHPMTDPKPIPLEDASGGKDATYDYSGTPWPEPKPEPVQEVVTPAATAAAAVPAPINIPLASFSAAAVTGYPPPYAAYTGAPSLGPDSWRVRELFSSRKRICDSNCDCLQI